jgi:hypothetical protein
MTIRCIFILLVCTSSLGSCVAQTYRTAVGLRVGTEIGLTVQQKLWKTGTVEAILTSNKERWQSQALVQYHSRLIGRRINSYVGIGPHYGESNLDGSYAGVTPIVGFEMTLFGLNVSYDYKPSINIFHGSRFIYHDSGLSVRFILIKQRRERIFKNISN